MKAEMTNKDYEILGFLSFIEALPPADKVTKFKEYSKSWYDGQRRVDFNEASKYQDKEFNVGNLKLKVVVCTKDSIIAEVVGNTRKSFNVEPKIFSIITQFKVGTNFIIEGVEYIIHEITPSGFVGVYSIISIEPLRRSFTTFSIDNLAIKLAKERKL